MIQDDDIEKVVDYMRDSAPKAAKAKAERIYVEEYKHVVKSQIMRENDDKSLGAQEAIAYADPRFTQHLEAIKEAVEKDEYHRWMLKAAEAKLEAWRTQCSNQRANL